MVGMPKKAWYQDRRSQGLCVDCSTPTPKSRCEKCSKRWRRPVKSTKATRKKRAVDQRQERRALRIELLDRAGGACARCNFDDWRALQVDHVNGDGYKEKRKPVTTRAELERRLARVLAGELQVLCANCNWIKFYEKREGPGRPPTLA